MERIRRAIEKARANAGEQSGFADRQRTSGHVRPGGKGLAFSAIQVMPVDPVSLERHRIIAGNKNDPLTASFDMLRTQVLKSMRENGYRTLAVTSPMPGCGKTTVAINLALSVVQQTAPNVFLGDFDLRRPKIGEYLGLNPEHDFSDFLEGRVSLEGVLIDPGIPRLLVLPNKKAYRNAAEMLTAPEIRSLIDVLGADDGERVNILDLPPMLPTDDTIAFLPQVDCVLLVVADGSTKKPELEETLRFLKDANLLGVVLNKSNVGLRPYY
jgi:Mrp family chromosome partitioning ATPase